MAGRNLFADEQQPKTKGRNLFAEEAQTQQPQAFQADVVGGDTRRMSHGSPFNEEGVTLPSFVEPAATIASSVIAEPLAGVAGIAQTINPLSREGSGAKAVQATREALTYKPKTDVGIGVLTDIGEAVAPAGDFVGDVEKGLGDKVFGYTGSPTLAAAATTIPTVLMEIAGLAVGKGAVTAARKIKKNLADGKIMREINAAVPTIEKLKDTSRGLYKEIDEMGVYVGSKSYSDLVSSIASDVKKSGLDADITPKANKALIRLEEMVGNDVTLSELDTLRKVAQNAANSIEPAEAMLGVRMINKIDDFLDNSNAKTLEVPQHIDNANVGKRYKVARGMWGRARRSELIQEAFEKARLQASGFENGIRVQFRSILNNKRKRSLFKPDEITAMKEVVHGNKKQNIAKLIGRLGFMEGGSTSVVGSAIGISGGAVIGGPVGAVIVPMIGQLSRNLAKRMTSRGAEFADQVIRAGSNAKDITKAYLKNTPKAQRSSQELSELLTRNDIDLTVLPHDRLTREAVKLAQTRRGELAGVSAVGAQVDSNDQ